MTTHTHTHKHPYKTLVLSNEQETNSSYTHIEMKSTDKVRGEKKEEFFVVHFACPTHQRKRGTVWARKREWEDISPEWV